MRLRVVIGSAVVATLLGAALVNGSAGVARTSRHALGSGVSEGRGHGSSPIRHVVVIFEENVSFDHYFGTYPNAANPPGEPLSLAVVDAAWDRTDHLTWGELDDAVDKTATLLMSLGVEKGDRVAVQLPNSREFVIIAAAASVR